jgi:hypothetical protein
MTKRTPQEKAERLILYFTTARLPAGPFNLNRCTVDNNISVSIETLTLRLRHSDPGKLAFRAAYMSLYELKQYIENEHKF